MSGWNLKSLIDRAGQPTERGYVFEDDDDKIITLPADINELGRQERALTSAIVEVDGDMERLRMDRAQLSERRDRIRDRIAAWARDHGCRSEAIQEAAQ